MRPIVLLLLALFGFVAVLAKKDDVSCVVHSNDCGKCVSNGCNWCADGYCVSAESDICEASKVSTTCGAKIPDQKTDHHAVRQSKDCESYTTCLACQQATGCTTCVDNTYKLFKCSSTNTCVTTGYALAYEWWIPAVGLAKLNFAPASCPVALPAGTNSPALNVLLPVYLFGSTATCDGLQMSFPVGKILSFLAGILPADLYSATAVIITGCSITPRKRQDIQPGLFDAVIVAKFADQGDITAQGVAATLLDKAPETFTVNSGTINVGPYLPGSGTGQVVSNKKNNNTSLSKGALAGIIIGSIVFGCILIALIVWLILRKRDSYPQAFRSPAAAYRP